MYELIFVFMLFSFDGGTIEQVTLETNTLFRTETGCRISVYYTWNEMNIPSKINAIQQQLDGFIFKYESFCNEVIQEEQDTM